MVTQIQQAARFLALHRGPTPLLLPNPWDAGSAKLLASLGFDALATTSNGFAATLGRPDGSVTRNEALDHAATIVAAVDLPVSADLENGFGPTPDDVAQTVAPPPCGLAGCSIEDFTTDPADPIYDDLAPDGPHRGRRRCRRGRGLVRADRSLRELPARPARPRRHDRPPAGLPGGRRRRALRPRRHGHRRPPPAARRRRPARERPGAAGGSARTRARRPRCARVSVGGAFTFAALGAVVAAARELGEHGTYGFMEHAAAGRTAALAAFT